MFFFVLEKIVVFNGHVKFEVTNITATVKSICDVSVIVTFQHDNCQ